MVFIQFRNHAVFEKLIKPRIFDMRIVRRVQTVIKTSLLVKNSFRVCFSTFVVFYLTGDAFVFITCFLEIKKILRVSFSEFVSRAAGSDKRDFV